MGIHRKNLFELKLIDLSTDDTVNSGGGTDDVNLQPPVRLIREVVKIWFNIPDPAGSTAGTHQLIAFYDTGFTNQSSVFQLIGNTGTDIKTYINQLVGDTEQPNAAYQQEILSGIMPLLASNTYKLIFRYINSTDVNQTGTRTIKVLVKEYPEGDYA